MKDKESRNRRAAGQRERLPADALGIPSTLLGGAPEITLSGNREALVSGCQGVLEYDEAVVRLACGKLAVRFLGRNLQIKVLTHDSAIVEGFITSVDFS